MSADHQRKSAKIEINTQKSSPPTTYQVGRFTVSAIDIPNILDKNNSAKGVDRKDQKGTPDHISQTSEGDQIIEKHGCMNGMKKKNLNMEMENLHQIEGHGEEEGKGHLSRAAKSDPNF